MAAHHGDSERGFYGRIKVISDDGLGSDESIILGIDRVCELAEAARKKG
ncbi:MAG: peptidase S8, partial [Chloroflexi bacterium CG07_land_8_20_14_0_80_51_10]